ncbi:MAG: hypothetical protein OXN27_03920 [Candidatus Poribacteria bacterium]|nr:hypothetical protein [Candidatus Poribacteria bacterium]
MFRLLAFLITCFFVFNMSILSIAQEQPTVPEVKAQPSSNRDILSSLKTVSACVGGAVLGGLVGGLIGNLISEPNTGLGYYNTPSETSCIFCIGGAVIGAVIMTSITSPSKPTTPSPNVLLGKSPAYIQAYIHVHQPKTATLKGLP